jgi:hypothetical protein
VHPAATFGIPHLVMFHNLLEQGQNFVKVLDRFGPEHPNIAATPPACR